MHFNTTRFLSCLWYNRSPIPPTRLQRSIGIFGSALSWFRSYLSNGIQTITVNGRHSQQTILFFGVPQGSVLDPMLFILYAQPLFDIVKKHTVNHHAFADGNQLYKVCTLDEIHQSIETLKNCITHFKSTNKIQLNDTKTEAMIALSNRMSIHTSLSSIIHNWDADVPLVSSAKNRSVALDSNLSMSQHTNTCKTAYIPIRHISSIRHLLTTQVTPCLPSCSLSFRLL